MPRVVLDLPDDHHVTLLANAVAEASSIRLQAAAAGARQADPADPHDARTVMGWLAEADWLRALAARLPAHVVTEPGQQPAPSMVDGIGRSALYPSVPPVAPAVATTPVAPPAPAQPRPTRPVTRMPGDGDLALRQLTLSPQARTTPGQPPLVDVAGPPTVGGGGDDRPEMVGDFTQEDLRG